MWDPRQEKPAHGGYLEGRVWIPDHLLQQDKKLYMRFSAIPEETFAKKIFTELRKTHPRVSEEAAMAFPFLLHNPRFNKNKARNFDLEPSIEVTSCYLLFEIFNGSVGVCNKREPNHPSVPNDPADNNSHLATIRKDQDKDNYSFIELGGGTKGTGLNIIALDYHGAKTFCVIKERLRGVVHEQELQDVYNKVSDFYKREVKVPKGKKVPILNEKAIPINEFRVRVQFFSDKDCKEPVEFFNQRGDLVSSFVSSSIKNVANKKDLLDILCTFGDSSCCKGGKNILIIAKHEFTKEDIPRFRVIDAKGAVIEEEISQPLEFNLLNPHNLTFKAPEQNSRTIKRLELEKYRIQLFVKRGSKSSKCIESPKKIDFKYSEHRVCECESYEKDLPIVDKACPGNRKRTTDENKTIEPVKIPKSSVAMASIEDWIETSRSNKSGFRQHDQSSTSLEEILPPATTEEMPNIREENECSQRRFRRRENRQSFWKRVKTMFVHRFKLNNKF